MRHPIIFFIIAVCLMFYPVAGITEITISSAKPKEQDDDVFKWLQAESVVITQIATKTVMDADLVPGMVTVLLGNDLENRGIKNVAEALTLIPGYDTDSPMIVRGAGSTFATGKIKLMLNSVPINNNVSGEVFSLDFLPISDVERIEVIRGPGSAVYGKWAFEGVVNVVTRKNENRIYGRFGSFNAYEGGGVTSYSNNNNNLKISLSASVTGRDDSGIESGPDVLYSSEFNNVYFSLKSISKAPGPINDSQKTQTAIMNLEYRNFTLLGQLHGGSTGAENGFSITNAVPPFEDRQVKEEDNGLVEIGWKQDILSDLKMNVHAGWRNYCWALNDLYLYPPGFPDFPDGMIGSSHYEETTLYANTDFYWNGWSNHMILFGLEYEFIDMGDIWQETNFNPVTYEPIGGMRRFTGSLNYISENENRGIFSLILQDQYEMTDNLNITAGLRYDAYDDTENRITPRIAGVYRFSEIHIFKAQYSEAFRPPSFMEMYSNSVLSKGNPDLDSELVKTSEFEYIFKHNEITSKITLFYSKLQNIIVLSQKKYENSRNAKTKGVEFEFDWNISSDLKVDGNIVYMDTKDKTTGGDIPNSTKWMGTAGLMWEPLTNWLLSIQYRFIGDRYRALSDTRGQLNGYSTFDFTATAKQLFIKGLCLRIGIKNIFNEVKKYAASPDFPEDIHLPGRECWIQMSYEF